MTIGWKTTTHILYVPHGKSDPWSKPILGGILVVGLGCSLGVLNFEPWPYGCGSKFNHQQVFVHVSIYLPEMGTYFRPQPFEPRERMGRPDDSFLDPRPHEKPQPEAAEVPSPPFPVPAVPGVASAVPGVARGGAGLPHAPPAQPHRPVLGAGGAGHPTARGSGGGIV